jgi:hypothetical protein
MDDGEDDDDYDEGEGDAASWGRDEWFEEAEEGGHLLSRHSGPYGVLDMVELQENQAIELRSIIDLLYSPACQLRRREKLELLVDVLFAMPRLVKFSLGKTAREHLEGAAEWGRAQLPEERRRYNGDLVALNMIVDGFPFNLLAATTSRARTALCRRAESVGDSVEAAEKRVVAELRTSAAGQMSAVATPMTDLVQSTPLDPSDTGMHANTTLQKNEHARIGAGVGGIERVGKDLTGNSGSMAGGAVPAVVAGVHAGAGASHEDDSFDVEDLTTALALSLETGGSAPKEAAGTSSGSRRTGPETDAPRRGSPMSQATEGGQSRRKRGPGMPFVRAVSFSEGGGVSESKSGAGVKGGDCEVHVVAAGSHGNVSVPGPAARAHEPPGGASGSGNA